MEKPNSIKSNSNKHKLMRKGDLVSAIFSHNFLDEKIKVSTAPNKKKNQIQTKFKFIFLSCKITIEIEGCTRDEKVHIDLQGMK